MVTVSAAPAEAASEAPRTTGAWSRRVFVAGLVVAVPVLFWVGRHHWFFLDEWLVLTGGGLLQPGYLDGHNGHWVTLLRLDYRLNFALFGLTTYVPYQVPVIAAHLGAAVLLRVTMLRLGVRGWLATAVALGFVFFGSGRDNITFAFQISMTGSVLAGLAVLLILDRAGPVTRADGWGLAVGLLGLMTSSVFVAVIVGAGVAALLRRGWRVAAFYTVPLGLVYAAWYLVYGSENGAPVKLGGDAFRFVAEMFGAVFFALGQNALVGAALAGVAAVGVASAVTAARRGDRRALALQAGLLTTWVMFAWPTALARAHIELTADTADASRYVHVGAAFLLPAVAAGVETLVRWRVAAGVVAVALLAVGVPGNLQQLGETDAYFTSSPELFGPDSRELIEAMAHSPFIDDVGDDRRIPAENGAITIRAGWLEQSAEAGRIAEPDGVSAELRLTATAHLVLAYEHPGLTDGACTALPADGRTSLAADDRVVFDAPISVRVVEGDASSRAIEYFPFGTSQVRALAGPIEVVAESGGTVSVCTG